MEKLKGTSKDLLAENINELRKLFPEAFTEDKKINFETLKNLLGEYVDKDRERYSFTWAGKQQARREAQKVSTGTLRPCKEESVNFDDTENLYIEGDNLEVLKLLQKSYHNSIKMIYIDPPYNTGKDFVYKDNYHDNLKNYKQVTGQVDPEGNKLSTNSDSAGRYHSNWLNMMYPRLKLARNLLKDDGVIFISIDDNEVHNLRKICDEIFGEENCLGVIANINNPKGRSDDKFIATSHEYIVVYSKNINNIKLFGFEPDYKIIKRYNKLDSDGKRYREIDLRKTGDSDKREDRPDMFYYYYFNENSPDKLIVSKEKVIDNTLTEVLPLKDGGEEGRWRWGFDTSLKKLDKVYAKYMPTKKRWSIFEKDYLEGRPPIKSTSSWTFKDVNSERGSEQLIELGFTKESFSRPKPIGTLRRILEIGLIPDEESIVLDFFSGSSGIVQAIYNLKLEKKRLIKFINIQLPEPLDNTEKRYKDNNEAIILCDSLNVPRTIAEIGKERIRRVINKIKEEQDEKIDNLDLGFKVLKLDSSNIKAWDSETENLEEDLLSAVNNIKEDRTEEDILFEVLLKYGLDLTLPIEETEIAGNKVFNVGMGELICCLSRSISLDTVRGIGKLKEEINPGSCRVVFMDNGFENDVVKTNAMQILKKHGIEEIRSI